jgi:hypothetical protein
MKRITYFLAISFVSVFLLFGCSKDKDSTENIVAPMTGYWLCTGIGGTAFGVNTPSIETKYLNLFSIGYVGLAGTGYYTRTGVKDFASAATSINAITAGTNGGSESWKNFFTSGLFYYDTGASTVTHTLDNGEKETFVYSISADGNVMTLTTKSVETPTTETVNSVVSAINSIIGTAISTNVGVVYTYKKASVAEIIAAINSSTTTASK